MASLRSITRRLTVPPLNPSLFSLSRVIPLCRTTYKAPLTALRHSRGQCSVENGSELFEYTSGRWIWNDTLRHAERKRQFNVSEFKRLAASSINRNAEEVSRLEKLGEGGFNRTFLITMHDGFQLVGRIPYFSTEPKHLVVASEVATMRFLRLHDIPVPEIYSYSTTSENSAGTEYIFMELVRGRNLGDIWFDLPEKPRINMVSRIAELEARLFALSFPASGSLYYTRDLDAATRKVEVPAPNGSCKDSFCVGPDTRLRLWFGRRSELDVDRGPFTDPAEVLSAGAKKEIAYLNKHGRPLLPFQRLYRELYNYQKVSPSEHVQNLEKYLQAIPHIIPHSDSTLTRPTLRHPDLQPNNIFVSEDENLCITGLIDWQHSALLPLFLSCGIPASLQNYGDSTTESLQLPVLPPNFDSLDESEQYNQVMLLRKRQLHVFYIAATEKFNPIHYNALAYDFSVLRRKLFEHASVPWEGDSITLKADLIKLSQNWSGIISTTTTTTSSNDAKQPPSCPIQFSEDEIKQSLHIHSEQLDSDQQLQACKDAIGMGSEGWVPIEEYENALQRTRLVKAGILEAAEEEEDRRMINEHWMFDDFDEGEYS